MCGFAGFCNFDKLSGADIVSVLRKMSATLVHRGPDSHGEWVDYDDMVALAHRRLAIQDLTPSGHQPMQSPSHRYVIVYNGEIYNFLELRHELQARGYIFRGGSDTEVMLATIDCWGISTALKKFTGMFAFALWDKQEKILTLARDRIGEKPLYYGWQKNAFLFGSELKALCQHDHWQSDINRQSITLFLRHNYIPTPHTIFKNIYKLHPGTYLSLKVKTKKIDTKKYWSLKAVYEHGIANQLSEEKEDIADELEQKILLSIKRQMIADVPVGAFLSGGIDSSTIVSLMQSIGTSPVKTFTIGFGEDKYNEAHYAREISNILNTDHTELYVTPQQAIDIIPELPNIYDEPFADSSQIPTYLVSRLAREQVTVSLSGDGGDELFCGYPRYFQASNYWKSLKKYPEWILLIASLITKGMPISILDRYAGFIVRNFTSRNYHNTGERLYEKADAWLKETLQLSYQHGISYWKDISKVMDEDEPSYVYNDESIVLANGSELQSLQYLDMLCYLPDDILTKVDRATMANGLESRIPLLDHNIIEYMVKIPPRINLLHEEGKWPLRNILYKYIPKEIIERPKSGFAVPICDWIKGPLFEWCDSLLNRDRLKNDGYFDPGAVLNVWNDHIEGKSDNSFKLWSIIMFQSWLDSRGNQQ